MSSWSDRMRACRRNLGSRTGEFWRENRGDFEIGYESPFEPGDALNRLWKDQELLFTHGDVQLAALVMANEHLFHRAWVGAPGVVVHGAAPEFEQDPDALLEIAEALRELRDGTEADDPDLAEIRAELVNGTSRASWRPVPSSIAGSRPCYVSTIFLDRGAMPDGWLAGSLFPILALQDRTPVLALLPFRVWPDDLVREWREQEPTGSCAERPVVEVRGYGWPVPVFLVGAVGIVSLAAELATGNPKAARELGWPMALSFAIAGAAILVFDLRERRPAPARYFAAACAHPIEVHYDRRFMFLKPRAWAWIAFGFAAIGTLIQVRR